MTNYRPLTRREQLEYQLQFLKQYKAQIEKEIEQVEEEYVLVRKKEENETNY